MRFGFSGAMAAAICIAVSPTHFILSREALDYTLMVPFAAAWVWLLADYLETRRLRSAIGLGVILGVGCYSYIAAWGAMPFLLAVSWAGVLAERQGLAARRDRVRRRLRAGPADSRGVAAAITRR